VLRKRVKNGRIIRLIGKWLRAGVMEDGVLTHPETGVPPRGLVSFDYIEVLSSPKPQLFVT